MDSQRAGAETARRPWWRVALAFAAAPTAPGALGGWVFWRVLTAGEPRGRQVRRLPADG